MQNSCRYDGANPQECPKKLQAMLKEGLNRKGLSIRRLSSMSGISAPTISRILTGKQPAGVAHLQLFAKHLELPIEALLEAVGIKVKGPPAGEDALVFTLLGEIFLDLGVDTAALTGDITKELQKLEQYAKTAEGKKTIMQGFEDKMATLDGMGAVIQKLQRMYQRFCAPDVAWEEAAAVGSALLYFISTVEVIPDYLYPIGHLDDAIAVRLVEKRLLEMGTPLN